MDRIVIQMNGIQEEVDEAAYHQNQEEDRQELPSSSSTVALRLNSEYTISQSIYSISRQFKYSFLLPRPIIIGPPHGLWDIGGGRSIAGPPPRIADHTIITDSITDNKYKIQIPGLIPISGIIGPTEIPSSRTCAGGVKFKSRSKSITHFPWYILHPIHLTLEVVDLIVDVLASGIVLSSSTGGAMS